MTFPASDLNGWAGFNDDPDPGFDGSSIWTTMGGYRVRICDMTNGHLLNTIRVLRNMSPIGTTFKTAPETRRRWINAMANEAYERGLQIDELTEKEPVHE